MRFRSMCARIRIHRSEGVYEPVDVGTSFTLNHSVHAICYSCHSYIELVVRFTVSCNPGGVKMVRFVFINMFETSFCDVEQEFEDCVMGLTRTVG